MPEDYTTQHNAKVLQDEAAKANETFEEDKTHRITKHQIFTKNGEKQVYHIDHDAGKVYVEGERGLLRYSSNNVEAVSAYPPFDEAVQSGAGYVKHTTPAGIVSYTTLDGQPYTPEDNDIEYSESQDGTYARVSAIDAVASPDASYSATSQAKQIGVKDVVPKAGVDQGPLTPERLENPLTNQDGVTDNSGALQQQPNHPETEGKTVDDLVKPVTYQRHKSVNGQTYYTDSNGNKVVKGDIPNFDTQTIEDIEDKE